MSDSRYGEASLRAREHFASKVTKQLNKNVGDQGLRFVKLTNAIPNWETYLTQKQREVATRYLKSLNAYEVDYQLKLGQGITQQRLFGSKTSRGAIGRLEDVYKMLETNGYFEQREKKKEAIKQELAKKSPHSEKTLKKVKELITLIIEMPNYEAYLTKSQQEKVFHFMRLRNFKKAANACGVSVGTYKRSLIGDNSVLEKLKKVNEQRVVNSWEEV